MKRSDNKGISLLYVNIALSIALIVIILLIIRTLIIVPAGKTTAVVAREKPVPSSSMPTTYDIDKVKQEEGYSGKAPADLKEMYENFPKSDVGNNAPEAWKRVSIADKEKIEQGLNIEIEKAKDTLKTNPEDKHARNILLMAESLKKITQEDFNYKIKKSDSK